MPTWSLEQQRLFEATYRATEKLRRYAPTRDLGSGLPLRRTVARGRYVDVTTVLGKPGFEPAAVHNMIKVVDLGTNPSAHNRWTGAAVPPPPGGLAVPGPTRGGLYVSADFSAVLAESFHYKHASTATVLASRRVADAFAPMVLVTARTERPLVLVDLDDFSPAARTFLNEIGGDPQVQAALKAMGPAYLGDDGRPSLIRAVYNNARPIGGQEYAASRAVGLALAAEPEFDGLLVASAQAYEPQGGGLIGGENNVVLFGADGKPVLDKLSVAQATTIVDRGAAGLEVTRYAPDGGGGLIETAQEVVT